MAIAATTGRIGLDHEVMVNTIYVERNAAAVWGISAAIIGISWSRA